MDKIFDEGNSQFYYDARTFLWQQDSRGSTNFWNRAGDKLYQVHEAVNLFEGIINPTKFVDVCGGPGAFSQMIFESGPL